jgi:DNA modification methylase
MGHHFRNAFVAQSWKLQSCLIWKKSVLCFGRADYHWMHEPILYGWKEGAAHRYYGDRKQTTILEFPTAHYDKANCDTDGYVHPTQKPTTLIEACINNSSQAGDIVLDLFGGSGSTLIACEKTGRTARLSEIDPRFATVIINRWEKLTGGTAARIDIL